MRRHRANSALPILAATVSIVAASCASGDDSAAETIPTSPPGTTIEDIIRDAGQFDDTAEATSDESGEDTTEDATSEESDEGTGEDDTAAATSTTAPADDGADDDGDDDPAPTTQPASSGTTTPTSSTVPPAGSPTTTAAPPAASTVPPTTVSPATTTPQNTTPPASGIDAAAALAGLNGLLAEVDILDGATELPLCGVDPTGAQIDAVFESLSTGVYGPAYGAVTAPLAIDIDEPYGTMLTCDRFDDSFDNGIGMSAIAAPDDLEAYSEVFANPDGIEGITITVTPAGSANGGDFFHVCSVDTVDADFSYCEVDWISDGLMVIAWIAGAESVNVDLATIQAALEPRLDLVLTNLSQAAA